MWQKQEIKDHRSGMTDIVKNSPPSFQEECVNLVHDNKEGNLEQRAGSTYFTEFDAPAKIRQIFQLEDYVFAYCYDDPVTPGDDIDGRIYWVKDDGSSIAWTEVETEGTDTTFKIRLRDSKNKGLDIEIPEADANFVNNVQVTETASAQDFPAISRVTGTNPYLFIQVLESRVDVSGQYIRGDTSLPYDYEDLKTAIEGAYGTWTVSYSPLTSASDAINFDDGASFQPDSSQADEALGIGNTTGRWLSTTKSAFIKEGHLTINYHSGIIYLDLEPFDKSFTPNNSDPYAMDPDAYPPDNAREPQRKLYLQNHDNVITPVLQNAQNSIVYIGIDEDETTSLTTSDKSYKFGKQTVRLVGSGGYGNNTVATLSIYYERGCAPAPILNYIGLKFRPVAGADRIDNYNTYTGTPPGWGQFFLYLSNTSAATVASMITRITALLDQAFSYTYDGGAFKTKVVLEEGNLSDECYEADTRDSGGSEILPTLVKTIPADAGNFSYLYAAAMKNTFQNQEEGSPSVNEAYGPVEFTAFSTLSEIGSGTIILNQAALGIILFTTEPSTANLVIGRHKNYQYSDTLHIPDTDACEVFRTQNNGTEFLLRKSFNNFTTDAPPDYLRYVQEWETKVGETISFTDNLADKEILSNEPGYFNGGVASYDSLTQLGSYYFTIVNQTGYHANQINGTTRVYESPPGVPYAAPGLFFQDFDDSLTGISHFSNKPIIFTPNTCWRWEGTNGANGGGRTFTRVISDEFGCVANQSIVRTNMGLFFWSKTGIVFTDGLRALRVTEHLINSYSAWLKDLSLSSSVIGPKSLRGTYDEINRRVLWSALDSDLNPITIVLDVFEGVSDKMPVFIEKGNTNVKWNGSSYDTINMLETSGIYFSEDNDAVYRAQDTRLLKVSSDATYDEYWTGTETFKIPIRPLFKSVAFDYENRGDRKWTSTVMFGFEDLAQNGVSLQPLGWNDLSDESHDLFPMVNYQHVTWSTDYAQIPQISLEQFGFHTDMQFKSTHIVSYKRAFPRNRIRNVFKQVGFKELPITLGTLSEGSGNVTNIDLTYVSGTGKNLVELKVTVSDTLDNALIDLGLDESGSFYAKWDNQDEWVKLHSFDLSGSIYTMQMFVSDEVSSDFTYVDAWPFTIGRVFSDQKIQLSDYTLRFKVIGDRTHGLVRSTEQGGFNG